MNLGTTEHRATNEIFSAVENMVMYICNNWFNFVGPIGVHGPNKNRDKTSSDSITKTVTFPFIPLNLNSQIMSEFII